MRKFIFLILIQSIVCNIIYGQIWYPQNSGTTKRLNSISFFVSDYIWVCGENGTVLKSTNGGTTWINSSGVGIPTTLNLHHIFAHKNHAYYQNEKRYAFVIGTDSVGSYIYMTLDEGINWNKVLTVTGSGAKLNAIWFQDTLKGFAEGEPISGRWQLWKTTNRGISWDSAGMYLNGVNYSGFVNNVCGRIDYPDSVLYFGANFNGTESRIFRSSNFGQNWSLITPGINHPMTSIFFLRYNNYSPSKAILGGNKYFSISTNAGSNWTTYDSSSFSSTQVCLVSEGGYLGPVFILKTDSLNMQSVYWGWSNYYYLELSGIKGIRHLNGYDYNAFLVGDSGKIYHRGILYPIVNKVGNEIIDSYKLYQNYPNPFNPSTTIKFDVSRWRGIKGVEGSMQNVTLKVYDILGKEVATLVNEKLQPGTYEVSFSISQFSDKQITSGIYFYRLTTDGFTETKRMVIIK